MNQHLTKFISLLFFLTCILIPTSPSSWAQGITTGSDDYVDFFAEEDVANQETTADISDPYESFNRAMFKFNDKMFDYVFSPLSKGYDFLVPNRVQKHINNIFSNIRTPVRLANNLFQLKIKRASTEMGRFLVNSVVGVGGIFDPATALELTLQDEDFGQTLGHYGVKSGFYLVLPFVGPSSPRDIIGFAGDTALNPLTWLVVYDVEPKEALFAARILNNANNFTYNVRDRYKDMRKSAIDPYIAIQHAYVQNRQKKIDQ